VTQKYIFDYQGYNSRLDEIQAAILSLKLRNLDVENEYRRNIAKRYLAEIKNLKIILPLDETVNNDAWHLFVVRTEKREEFRTFLSEKGIGTEIHYPVAPHKQLAYREWQNLSLPITEKIHQEVVSLPLNIALNETEISYIIQTVNQF
jgi:dTDP-4-amino-4,6-dideoxygalactose transaminase